MIKKDRLSLIKNIIESREIATQEELTEALNKLGHNVSQATVSRDINELSLTKVVGHEKKFKYSISTSSTKQVDTQLLALFKHGLISMERANNLIVIKTISGNASTAGLAIDQMNFSQVVGTVAGDDTLLVIVKTNADAEHILKKLKAL